MLSRMVLPGVVVVLGLSGVQAQSLLELPEGYRAELLHSFDPGVDPTLHLQSLCYSPEGEPVLYENGELRIVRGDSKHILARFEPARFGSFCVPMPGGLAVLFGENSEGDLFEVALDGSGAENIGNLPFNFDAAFAPQAAGDPLEGQAFISALGPVGNSIYRFDPEGERTVDEIVTAIPDFSGPLTFDDLGHLYYVTASLNSQEALVRFTPEQLLQGIGEGALDFSEAEVILSDLDGAFHIKWNHGKFYLTNLGFNSGVGEIEIIDSERNFQRSVFATIPLAGGIASPSSLAMHPGSEDFEPGAGSDGGKMLVQYGDFFAVSHLVEVTPELHFVRAEVNGDGEVDLSDAVYVLSHLFLGGPPPRPAETADINADGKVDIADPIYLLEFLFRGGPLIPPPFPEPGAAEDQG